MALALCGCSRRASIPTSPIATRYAAELAEVEREVASYNTGHRQLDDFRRSIFGTALVFVKRTLKTNFFVAEKHALAFRLDPAYLEDLGPTFTADLPAQRPFRVTFFFGRSGLGYHIGFADIARGGWRTIFAKTRDDYVTVANTLFRENTCSRTPSTSRTRTSTRAGRRWCASSTRPGRDAGAARGAAARAAVGARERLPRHLRDGGRPKDPRVVDYYREEEPIELGPDENMHDEMIEAIAALSVRRGYVLGSGIMSSKGWASTTSSTG